MQVRSERLERGRGLLSWAVSTDVRAGSEKGNFGNKVAEK